jgi:hypothetical protein
MTEEKVCGAVEKDFQFWMPLDVVKAPGGEMRVGGIATDEGSSDIQGEKVFVDGLDISYLKSRGAFNWNHQKGPGDIIGEIDIAQKQGGKLYVEGPLYPHVDQAKQVYNLIRSMKDVKSDRQLGLSIEGKIKERDAANQKLIKKAWIKNVAITYNPINQGTWVDMIKSLGDFQFSPCDGDCKKCSLCECPSEVKKNMPDPVEATSLSRAEIPDPMAHAGLGDSGKAVDTAIVEEADGRASDLSAKKVCTTCGKPMIDGLCYVCNPPAMSVALPEAAKALAAGHDIAATTGGVSGSALRDEDLEKKKKTTTYTKKDMTKGELALWFFEKGYSVNEAAALAHLIFLSNEVDLEKAQIKGHQRMRRGHSEWVKPHERRLSKEDRAYKEMLTGAMERWHKLGGILPFAPWLRGADKKTYDKLVSGIGTRKQQRTSMAGGGMRSDQRERVVRDFAEVLGLPAKREGKTFKMQGEYDPDIDVDKKIERKHAHEHPFDESEELTHLDRIEEEDEEGGGGGGKYSSVPYKGKKLGDYDFWDKVQEYRLPVDSHESDLYIPVNEKSKALVAAYTHKENVTTFYNKKDGKTWYDIPFAYAPFWEKKQKRI